jgi:hypothetical protein
VLPEFTCPICNADVPIAGDERPGDDVFCTYCSAPCVIKGESEDPSEWELEEDV